MFTFRNRCHGKTVFNTPEAVAKFISLIKKYPILYDRQCPQKHNVRMRKGIWESIAEDMNQTPGTCGILCFAC